MSSGPDKQTVQQTPETGEVLKDTVQAKDVDPNILAMDTINQRQQKVDKPTTAAGPVTPEDKKATAEGPVTPEDKKTTTEH